MACRGLLAALSRMMSVVALIARAVFVIGVVFYHCRGEAAPAAARAPSRVTGTRLGSPGGSLPR